MNAKNAQHIQRWLCLKYGAGLKGECENTKNTSEMMKRDKRIEIQVQIFLFRIVLNFGMLWLVQRFILGQMIVFCCVLCACMCSVFGCMSHSQKLFQYTETKWPNLMLIFRCNI